MVDYDADMSRLIEKILEILQSQAENAADLFDIAASDRSTSYKKARRSLLHGPPEFKTDWADWYRQRHAFQSLLNKLKRDGLITRIEKKKGASWGITKSGQKKLYALKKKKAGQLVTRAYVPQPSAGLVVIAYDVPERERRKRYWLRAALISLGFKKLQQSVWTGNAGIPAELVYDLKTQRMLSYVHVFSVNKKGTIQKQNLEEK